MAHFPYCYEITVGSVTVAEIEGYALLTRNEPDHTDWQIEKIMVDGWGGETELPKNHYLYAPILTYLLTPQRRHELDACWEEAVAESKAMQEVV
jgi:hypothetical protein